MEDKRERRLVSLALQGSFIAIVGIIMLTSLSPGEWNIFFAMIFYLPLGIVQLGDALIGVIMGERWRTIYFFIAITYLFTISVISELPFMTYDIEETFELISLLILPGIMALSYCYLTYKNI